MKLLDDWFAADNIKISNIQTLHYCGNFETKTNLTSSM